MLTVKNVLPDGQEALVEVDQVHFSFVVNEGDLPRTPYLEGRLGETTYGFNSGMAYVMNSNGATVGSYQLQYPQTKPSLKAFGEL